VNWWHRLFLLVGLLCVTVSHAEAQDVPKTLKIGVLGVMSGHARSWGMTNRYCAEVTAQIYNEQGGLLVDGVRYPIEIIAFDTEFDPVKAAEGARYLIAQGVRYIIGPNIDDTTMSVAPIIDAADAINISYGFNRAVYSRKRGSTILGMAASYQVAPLLYRYLQQRHGIRRIAFIARDDSESINQRNMGIEAAHNLGFTVVDLDVFTIEQATYQSDLSNLPELLHAYLDKQPELIVLPSVAPSDAPMLIRKLREFGYGGIISTETAQDFNLLAPLGEAANGFIALGGTAAQKEQSQYMKDFVRRYTERAGQWNDEAGTKVYALEIILRTIQFAGASALDNTMAFKEAMGHFSVADPFTATRRQLKFVGVQEFGGRRQINVPVFVKAIEGGTLIELYRGDLPD
jgi:branched-chain amino acid transport system substrate-binding protein